MAANPYDVALDDVGGTDKVGESSDQLTGAVPPAGEYLTSGDYRTLYAGLSTQYVTEVIQKYEATLGPSPELYAAALKAGYLTPEQAQAMQAGPGPGSLQQKFASQGGLRTLAGPYQSARTQLLEQAFADIQTAAAKASEDAYKLASMTTGQRIQALTAAGQLRLGMVNAGVSRQNARGAAEAAMHDPPPQPPFQVPAAPPPPGRPSLWEQILPAAVAGGFQVAGRALGPKEPTPEERADNVKRFNAAMREDRGPGSPGKESQDPGLSDPTSGVINPYTGGGDPMQGGWGNTGGAFEFGQDTGSGGFGNPTGDTGYGGGWAWNQNPPSYDNYNGGGYDPYQYQPDPYQYSYQDPYQYQYSPPDPYQYSYEPPPFTYDDGGFGGGGGGYIPPYDYNAPPWY